MSCLGFYCLVSWRKWPAPFVSFCRFRSGLCPRYVSSNEHNSHILAILCALTLFGVSIWVSDARVLVFLSDSVVIALTRVQNPTFADCDVYTIKVGWHKAGSIHFSFDSLFLFSLWAFGMYKCFVNVVIVVVESPLVCNRPFARALQRYALLCWHAPERPSFIR